MTRAQSGGGIRLVALGYQGFGNLGDEAILTGIEAILADSGVSVGWVVCGPQPASVAAFPKARRIPAPRLLPSARAIRAIARSDGLLLSGGGLIHDHWPTIVARYLLWIVLARALGRRVVWLGVGVGPLRRRSQRWLARLALGLSTAALVRDAESASLLGGGGEKVTVVPDAAIFNPSPSGVVQDRRRVGVIVRGPISTSRADPAALARDVVALVAGLRRHDRDPEPLTLAGTADDAFTRQLVAEAQIQSIPLEVVPLGPTPQDALRRLAGCSATVSIRLHGLVLSAAAGVPCVPVAYDAKVRSAADALGLAEAVIGLEELDPETVLERLDRATSPEATKRMETRVAAMRGRRAEIAEAVAGAFGGQDR